MKPNSVILIAATLIFSIGTIAQAVPGDAADKAAQRRIKKQILVMDLENRTREISLAAPRVMARYRIAAWLWTDGKDDVGRAEEFAVDAVNDLFKNRGEVPSVYFTTLSSGLFTLLDRHSPTVSKGLKEKYKVNSADEAAISGSLPGGEKAAVDAAISSLYGSGSLDLKLVPLLSQLRQRNSPHLRRVLDAMVAAEERNRERLTPAILAYASSFYAATDVPAQTARRFGVIVMDRSQAVSLLPFADFDIWLDILNSNMRLIAEKAPERVADSMAVHAVLSSRLSQQSRAARERDERIKNSSDNLGALIDEAEKTDDPLVKYDLYRRAARLALDMGLYKRSADLTVLFGAVDVSTNSIVGQTQKNEVGQMLEAVVGKALKAGDDVSALYAVDRFSDNDRRATGYGNVAEFYVEKGDRDSARQTMQSALRAAAYIESLSRRASIYFKLIPITHSIDPTSVFEINSLAARTVNAVPSLNAEDKPETENYRNHVTGLMSISWNFFPMITSYSKTDRSAAADLSGRIEKKEVKVFADLVLGVASLDDEKKAAPKSEPVATENELR